MALPGILLSFEGGEGCGKSTHARKLAAELKANGYDVLHTREPGGTPLGERIRTVLLNSKEDLHPLEEFLMFSSARAHLVRTVILPALAAGRVVIIDRFYHSSYAYQGAGGLDTAYMREVTKRAVGECEPDAVLLLDISAEAGLERCVQAGKAQGCADRFERRGLEFHRRVRELFLDEAQRDARFTVVDSTGEFDEVHSIILAAAMRAIRAKRG